MADFDTATRQKRMISARADAAKRKYHKVIGKSGTVWLYADQPNAGDNVYSHHPGVDNSKRYLQGFGGATLKFSLVDGGEYVAKGPWHTNAEAMYRDTGVDLRQTHYTFVVIGMGVDRSSYRTSMHGTVKDVIHKDDKPTLGFFNRGNYLARELATKLGKNVYLYRDSDGGSSSGFVKPNEEIPEMDKRW